MKLDPAKPFATKSVLKEKIAKISKDPLPPISSNHPKDAKKDKSAKNGQAFEVVFDENSDQLKTKKYSKFSGLKKTKNIRLASQTIDDR